jgi:hypothetical protein
MCLASAKLLLLWVGYPGIGHFTLKPNGTAVEGVCITGAASRVLVLVASSETVPVARQYGAIFAITVRVGFITIAVQVYSY